MRARATVCMSVFVFLTLGVSHLGAWEWPIADAGLIAYFGGNSGRHFIRGIDAVPLGDSDTVRAAADGELVFAQDERRFTDLSQGLGSFVILEHEGELRSLYGHLEAGSLNPQREDYSRGDAIGAVGASGAALGPRVRFEIFDRELSRQVNPLLILPPRPDERNPTIAEFTVAPTGGNAAEVRAEVYDTVIVGQSVRRIGVQSVRLFVNEEAVVEVRWDSIQVTDGVERLSGQGNRSPDRLYLDSRVLDLGSVILAPGENVLRLEASDLSGNVSNVRREIIVAPEDLPEEQPEDQPEEPSGEGEN